MRRMFYSSFVESVLTFSVVLIVGPAASLTKTD